MTAVWITGAGAITPLGVDLASSFEAALAAKSAVVRADAELSVGLPNMLVAPVRDDLAACLQMEGATLDRASLLALIAGREAMSQAGLEGAAQDDPAGRFGVFCGIGFGGAHTLDALYARYFDAMHGDERRRRSATVMHPLAVPRMMANGPMAALAMRYGLRGTGNTYSVACASSAIAAGEALRAIEHGYLDAALVVGCEAILTRGSLVAWNALRVLAKCDADDPSASCKPFAANRSGFVLGEGAGALVLERAERAQARGATAQAQLAGYGSNTDAAHLTAPTVSGQAAAMKEALRHAGLRPEQIGYLNAHGTATAAGDVTETQSVEQVFGDHARALPISSTKAVHGHLIGAGGTVELALALKVLQTGSVPPTAHLHQPDPACTLDYVPLVARHGQRIDAVMSNSFAFGGSNACLVARRAD